MARRNIVQVLDLRRNGRERIIYIGPCRYAVRYAVDWGDCGEAALRRVDGAPYCRKHAEILEGLNGHRRRG